MRVDDNDFGSVLGPNKFNEVGKIAALCEDLTRVRPKISSQLIQVTAIVPETVSRPLLKGSCRYLKNYSNV